MWTRQGDTWKEFQRLCLDCTGTRLGCFWKVMWKWICPSLCALLVLVSVTPPFAKVDVLNARTSKPFPEGGQRLEAVS